MSREHHTSHPVGLSLDLDQYYARNLKFLEGGFNPYPKLTPDESKEYLLLGINICSAIDFDENSVNRMRELEIKLIGK
ncbi:MAG TPA: hypothetical protein VG895_04190 [Patescibacteria group bacterium]|nr:hypothetical protein [Patescibacteria group bacterium]